MEPTTSYELYFIVLAVMAILAFVLPSHKLRKKRPPTTYDHKHGFGCNCSGQPMPISKGWKFWKA